MSICVQVHTCGREHVKIRGHRWVSVLRHYQVFRFFIYFLRQDLSGLKMNK